ncbi:hypothetical protein [Mucilaginibacter psychrotolerans]|uniref:DUF4386 family protein n=1 Tax=Mucilaginibacter psychrotolerans TaxID=1524096 RepID=A0A4Y8SF22_9SPHI|nr:hypothetical protein [Mucilaginibacter psychrotolerans]TFF37127.1 hypothetical protein E2R66_13680 [Mucilaginibacter psychrotolerans]
MEEKDLLAEISSIRNIMDRSTKFISLSGLSGIMAGIYALLGAGAAYRLLYTENDSATRVGYDELLEGQLVLLAIAVLIFSVATGLLLTVRKAGKKGQSVWNQSSQSLLLNGAVPLVAGGIFCVIMLLRGYYVVIGPCTLIFYGLALIAASKYTFGDVKWLGLLDVGLGLLAAIFPGYGLFFWAFGFGVLHILYGTIMHFKYDR